LFEAKKDNSAKQQIGGFGVFGSQVPKSSFGGQKPEDSKPPGKDDNKPEITKPVFAAKKTEDIGAPKSGGLFDSKKDTKQNPVDYSSKEGSKPKIQFKLGGAISALKNDDNNEESKGGVSSKGVFGSSAKPETGKSVFPTIGKKDDAKSPFLTAKPEGKPSPFGDSKDKPEGGIKDPNREGVKPSSTTPPFLVKKDDKKDPKGPVEEKAGDDKKPEGPKSSEIEVIKKMSIDQVKQTTMNSTSLEDIFSSWYNKIENQSDAYKKHAKQLKKEELELYDTITTLESLNQYSERVIQDYGQSISTMEHLARQQEHLMKSLDDVETDVDQVISKKTRPGHGFHKMINGYEPIEVGNYRQQMDAKAKNVNQTLDRIEDTIYGLGKVLSSSRTDAAQEDNKESEEFGNILNKSYDTLRWIQDTACDLNYQIELIDRELQNL
jgi:hypothetical protein